MGEGGAGGQLRRLGRNSRFRGRPPLRRPEAAGIKIPAGILSCRIESSWRRMWSLESCLLTNSSRYRVSMTIMAGILENQKSPVRSFSLVAVMMQ